MGIIKNIHSVFIVIVFVICLVTFVPVFLLYSVIYRKNSASKTHYITRLWGKILLFFSNIRIKVHKTNFNYDKGSYIFVSNHRSLVDIVVCSAVIPVKFLFLAKRELLKVPLFGFIIKKTTLQVDRKSQKSKLSSFNNLKRVLLKGMSVLLFPEGTRNNTEEKLSPFQNGAFKLAVSTGIPIVVLTLWDTTEHFNTKFRLTPGIVHFYISDPIYPDPSNPHEMDKLKKQSIQIMSDNIDHSIRLKDSKKKN